MQNLDESAPKKQVLFLPILTLSLILAVALFFRLYQVGQVPPGLFGDEATLGLEGLDVLAGNFFIYTPREGSSGALERYLLALYFMFVNPTITSLRTFASIVGVLSIVVAYFVIRQLSLSPLKEKDVVIADQWREVIAGVGALLLTVSYWHVDQSRLAFSAGLMLLGQDVTFFLLWRALVSGRRIWFVGFGLSLGSMMYHYLPGKVVPAVPLLFFLLEGLITRHKALLIKYWRSLVIAGVIALVITPPLLFFVLFNYETVFARAMLPAGAVASLSPLQAIITNLNRFGLGPTLWLSGQWNAFFLGPFLTICFVGGIVTCLVQFKRPAYLFLLVWWGVMVMPGVLAAEGIPPHARRAIGAATPTFALTAVGLASLVIILFWLAQKAVNFRLNRAIPLVTTGLLGLILVTWTGVNTFQRYFWEWGTSEEAKLAFHVYDLELAEIMARESGAETVYLLPLDSSAGIINPVLDNITFVYKGQATYDFLPDDEQTLPVRLSQLTANKQIVRLLHWKVSKHTGADPKDVINYYLEQQGQWVEKKSYRYFDIETYQLAAGLPLFAPAELNSTTINFEEQLSLTGYSFGPEANLNGSLAPATSHNASTMPAVPAGNRLWAELRWQKVGLHQGAVDYQVSLWLEDEAGHIVGRADKLLLSNIAHLGTSQWSAGAEERDYYLLPVDPTVPPGQYSLKAVLYERATGRRLTPVLDNVGADLAVPLGDVEVLPPQTPVDPASIVVPQRLDFTLENGLHLVGIDPGLTGSTLRPGDQLTLRLWAYPTQPLPQNMAVVVGLSQANNSHFLNEPQLLGSKKYPTTKWQAGTPVQTFIDVRLPRDIKSETSTLGIRLLDMSHNQALAELPIKQVQIEARPHTFDRPSIPHPLEANFSNEIKLLGYNLDLSQVESGGVVRIKLYWQALAEMDVSYKVFIHFLNEADQIVTQIDREPQAGESPTSSWIAGEIIIDALELPVNENLATVTHLTVGLYNPADGKRLAVIEGDGGQVLDKLTIPLQK